MRKLRSARPGWIAGGVLAVVVLGLPVETLASCQTEWCHQRSRLRDREREATARAAVAAAPEDGEAVRRLLEVLAGKVGRERAIAEYEARYRWEPAPDLTELEAEVAAERRRLSERLVRLERDDAQAWCRHAHQIEDREARVELLRRRLTERPAETQLAVCLARELAGLGRTDEALVLLRAFLVEHPEPLVASELVRLLDKDEAAVLAVREAMAACFGSTNP